MQALQRTIQSINILLLKAFKGITQCPIMFLLMYLIIAFCHVQATASTFGLVGLYTTVASDQSLFIYNSTTNHVFKPVVSATAGAMISWCIFHSQRSVLYCVHELDEGLISAFELDHSDDEFHVTLLNTVSSAGSTPVYLSLDPLGYFIFSSSFVLLFNSLFLPVCLIIIHKK